VSTWEPAGEESSSHLVARIDLREAKAEKAPATPVRHRIIHNLIRLYRDAVAAVRARCGEEQCVAPDGSSAQAAEELGQDALQVAAQALAGMATAKGLQGDLARAQIALLFEQASQAAAQRRLTAQQERHAEERMALERLERVVELMLKLGVTPKYGCDASGRMHIILGDARLLLPAQFARPAGVDDTAVGVAASAGTRVRSRRAETDVVEPLLASHAAEAQAPHHDARGQFE
jgi:hypothetical protein